MGPKLVRRLVIVVFAAGIAGMISGSVADNNGVALTFGLITAAAALCLIVATAVGSAATAPADAQGARVEDLVGQLVAAGADEPTVRALVGEAVRLGRGDRRP